MKKTLAMLLITALLLGAVGCGGAPAAQETQEAAETAEPSAAEPQAQAEEPAQTAEPQEAPEDDGHPELPGLTYQRAMEKVYATQFDVYYYEGGYKYLAIGDGNNYLVVPEGAAVPEGLDPTVKVLQQPLNNIYLAATSTMSLFDAIDSLDTLALTSLNAEDWYVDGAREAMEKGEILFGGKYSEPDYELLVDSNVSVAIENTMILHTPKVMEMIEMLEIPVFIEYSSYEPHPLGRTEWMKLFAAMINREEQAEEVFNRNIAVMNGVDSYPSTGKTAAIFLVDSNGSAQVRSADDYLTKILELAGGVNAFTNVTIADSGRSNVSMTMEEFYATAVDVDYLIYNASGYSSDVDTMDKLLAKSDLLSDCKAVKEGNVWWIGGEAYQQSDKLCDLITDVHMMLTGQEGEMTFLHKMV